MVYRPRVCLDSSVAVKWFRIEENSKGAFDLRKLAEAERIKLVFSAIVLTESARGLKKLAVVMIRSMKWRICLIRSSAFAE